MDREMIGMCGAYCGLCKWVEKTGCKGCQHNKGKMFWGTCAVAVCCADKGLMHCGLCPDVPCQVLQEAFDEPEHGDDGERLANLIAWANGEDTIIDIGSFKTKQSG